MSKTKLALLLSLCRIPLILTRRAARLLFEVAKAIFETWLLGART